MKIYKRSIMSANMTKSYLIPFVIAFGIFPLFIPMITNWSIYFYFIVGTLPFISLLFISRYFYVILTDQELIIQNGIFKFWGKKYKYTEIKKITLRYEGGKYVFTNMLVTNAKKHWLGYTIDLVDESDYSALIRALRAKGIICETIGMDHFFKKYP